MLSYTAPIDDYQFLLHDVFKISHRSDWPGYADLTPDVTGQILREAGKVAAGALLPLNQSGDAEGCRFENGKVFTPTGFREAYQALVGGGWLGLGGPVEYGGQGLPAIIGFAVAEFMASANLGLSGYVDLTKAAARLLKDHGSAAQKDMYLEKLVTGEWGGAMALTEPGAGTDLSLIKCSASKATDGGYRLSGPKLFITGSAQDLTENIVILALARTENAPQGTKGLSLFLVPRWLPNDDGSPGKENGVKVISVEHKMGVHSSATCALSFEEAYGEIVGEESAGLNQMFTMMNDTRLGVGLQGIAVAETALQNALAYTKERVQGRAPMRRNPAAPADPIIQHPDVRRMLLEVKSFVEGARALAVMTALFVDESNLDPNGESRTKAGLMLAILTPVIKAHFSDQGSQAANLAMQCFGGHGYIREWGMEQLVRDVRVTQIYEGANGVQALDLAGRKVSMMGGEAFALYCRHVDDTVSALAACRQGDLSATLHDALASLGDSTGWIVAQDRYRLAEAADDYMKQFASVTMCWMWGLLAAAGHELGSENAGLASDKIATARYAMARHRIAADHAAQAMRNASQLPDLPRFFG